MLENQVVLVTGASRGIGQSIAHTLGKQQASVIGTATTEAGAQKISDSLAENGILGTGMVLNVADSESVTECLKKINADYGAPDILVNNAGVTQDNLLMMMKDEQWEEIINTNLTSIFRMTKAVVRPMMKKRSGRIINVSSVIGSIGNPGQTNYAAAKAGLVGFSKSLAREIGSRNITVNTVSPGFIDTDMTKQLDESRKQALIDNIPLGRLGSADDIAAAVLFLASPSAAYITGENIHVNGGMFMP